MDIQSINQSISQSISHVMSGLHTDPSVNSNGAKRVPISLLRCSLLEPWKLFELITHAVRTEAGEQNG
jgi:hypothetical protein